MIIQDESQKKTLSNFVEQLCEDSVVKVLRSKLIASIVAPYGYKEVPKKVLDTVVLPLVCKLIKAELKANLALLVDKSTTLAKVRVVKAKQQAEQKEFRQSLSLERKQARDILSAELGWAEAWFIGTCRPMLNREGARARGEVYSPPPSINQRALPGQLT